MDYNLVEKSLKNGLNKDINWIDIKDDLSLDSYYKTDIHIKQTSYPKIIKELVTNMNLNYKDFGFDWKTDTADAGDHLNVYGAEKVSKYLGKIIQEKYNIPNRKNDEQY